MVYDRSSSDLFNMQNKNGHRYKNTNNSIIHGAKTFVLTYGDPTIYNIITTF